MKNMKKILTLLLAMAMVLSFVGCGTKADNASDKNTNPMTNVEPTSEPTTEPTTEPTKVTVDSNTVNYPLTIKDSNGTEITFESEPEKVVSVAPNISELIYAIGAGERLVGRTDYCDYPEEVLSVESIGTLRSPDIEKIISLEPDVVIASTHFLEESEKQLTDLGIKVVVLYEEHDVTGVYTMIETLGDIFNVKENATKVVNEMKTTIEEVTTAVKDLEAPSVYYVVGYGEGGDYTAGGDTFVGQLITMAGGKNIAQEVSGWSYSLESLMEADPDVIVLPEYYKDDFMTADNYKELSAVKNGKVYVIDTNLLDRQGNRNAEGIKELAKLFHPEAFENK